MNPSAALNAKKIETSKDLVLQAAKSAIDKKAENSIIFDVGATGAFTDYFLITSGTSDRQVQAIADEILRNAKASGHRGLIEGYDEGRWVLIDFGNVVVHVFQQEIREFYDLEALWSDAARVRIPQEYYGNPNDIH